VAADKATAMIELKRIENDFYSKDVNKITVADDVAVILLLSGFKHFHKPYTALIKKLFRFFQYGDG
jgi:aspartokinase/homoserine dehydrogenase 1